ncbi:hypothetical protein P1P68_35595 [Streptomyces scabiei]|uniref:hypothetical protein n=1 Tax=Streptomyces scabiei TaxID=1930 RepID=UPI0029903A8A|nr:hypothetical protein [Streptomyces scabiei]MDW8809981.1 hypothetical protein [Streptomyces scabiei]
MEQSEIMRRVVGILTEAIELRRQVREHLGGQMALTGQDILERSVTGRHLIAQPKVRTPSPSNWSKSLATCSMSSSLKTTRACSA